LSPRLRCNRHFHSNDSLRWDQPGAHKPQKLQSSWDSVLPASISTQEVGLFLSPLCTGLARRELVFRSPDTGLQTHRRSKLQPETSRTSKTRDYQLVKAKHKKLNNRNQDDLALSEPSTPTTARPAYLNTPEKQDSDLKSYVMLLIEDFKKDINNSLKQIQENMGKQVKELNKTLFDFFIVSTSIFRSWLVLFKNSKCKNILTQNIQEIQNTSVRRPNLRIIGTEESKDSKFKGSVNTFNKIIEENFPNQKKEMPMHIQEAYRTPNSLDQKKNSSSNIIVKISNAQNKTKQNKAKQSKTKKNIKSSKGKRSSNI
jgi:hypothetical protein